ncbi:MAG: indole-3-glycerol phosphate synthase TrpC [Candidatus Omnitrophica bacterium]|nr:indole-3-glycerol phosphate synthase TrpC [Candidatus Omnitrophota bacterium]
MILDEIVAHKREEIEAAKQRLPLDEFERRVRGHRSSRSFRAALTQTAKRPALIAELKRKSPSRGMLRERFDPVRLAQELQEAGASALSVLTDERYFGGSLEFLRDAQAFTDIPILRKDFILEPYQVYEAAFAQADAVLLITQLLNEEQLTSLRLLAEQFGMEALVEVHAEEELSRALKSGASLIGINHRDLRTFTMHPDTTSRLVPHIPSGCVIVAESGVQSSEDVKRLRDLGVHAVLIGESLMTSPDVNAKVRELFAGAW